MPLQRRLPKRGFRSQRKRPEEVRLNELSLIEGDVVELASLKAAGVIPAHAESARIILSGEITSAVTVKGLGVTKGARSAIESAGGKVED